MVPSDRAPQGGLGRVVFGAVAFALIAPIGLIALPLATLTVAARARNGRALLVGLPAALLAAAWLVIPGDLPDQTVRASAIMATAAFVSLSARTHWRTVHRALAAVGIAAAGLGAGFLTFGWSWERLHWWVAYRTAATLRFQLGLFWTAAREQLTFAPPTGLLRQFEAAYQPVVQSLADLFPAMVALQLMAGFVLAFGIHQRTADRPIGDPPRWFRAFRFSEHLGWIAALPLATVLSIPVPAVRLVAGNVLAVMAALYALRGLAVGLHALRRLRAGPLLYAVLAVALLFMLPVAVAAALILGVVDAGLDLRRRWSAPPAAD